MATSTIQINLSYPAKMELATEKQNRESSLLSFISNTKEFFQKAIKRGIALCYIVRQFISFCILGDKNVFFSMKLKNVSNIYNLILLSSY